MTRHGYNERPVRMLEDTMASTNANQFPSIALQQPDNVSNFRHSLQFHAQCLYLVYALTGVTFAALIFSLIAARSLSSSDSNWPRAASTRPARSS